MTRTGKCDIKNCTDEAVIAAVLWAGKYKNYVDLCNFHKSIAKEDHLEPNIVMPKMPKGE